MSRLSIIENLEKYEQNCIFHLKYEHSTCIKFGEVQESWMVHVMLRTWLIIWIQKNPLTIPLTNYFLLSRHFDVLCDCIQHIWGDQRCLWKISVRLVIIFFLKLMIFPFTAAFYLAWLKPQVSALIIITTIVSKIENTIRLIWVNK